MLFKPTRIAHTQPSHTIMAAKKTAKKSTESVTPKAGKSAAPAAKKAAKKATKTTASAKPAAPKSPAVSPVKHSADQIARAAYLNYRRRVEQGLPGDSHGDWLEAERQLGKH